MPKKFLQFTTGCRQIFFAAILMAFAISCRSQQLAIPVSSRYSKLEQMIMMRDGTRLYTAIYVPRDSNKVYPFLITRTPYSCAPYGQNNFPASLNPNTLLDYEGYIFVFQDVRGRYQSEGIFQEMTPFIPNKQSTAQVDESSDAYDTIEWLLKNIKGHNGKVGLTGVSYPGFYAMAALPNGHPAIAAVSPQAPVLDEFEGDDVYHNGAFFLMDNLPFVNQFGMQAKEPVYQYKPVDSLLATNSNPNFYLETGPLGNINKFFFKQKSTLWNEYLQHDTKDAFWQSRDMRPWLKNINAAVLNVGGWFDAEDLYGSLHLFKTIENQNPARNNYLIMGPWIHGGWRLPEMTSYASYSFGKNPNQVFFASEAKFFRHFLKDEGDFDFPKAAIYFTGSNEWKTFVSWPPPNTRNYDLYLVAGNKLSTLPEPGRVGAETYESNPDNPVPYSANSPIRRNIDYLGEDQRFLAGRTDLLNFTSDELKNTVTLAGPIVARLFVTLTSTDADFVVKIIDVHPDKQKTQQLVRAEVLRGKFRNSLSNPEPFVPGKITPVAITLNDVAHSFQKGHKIMVQIQSSWFPLVDLNPQQFMRIPDAEINDFQKATISIQRNARYQSVIQCKILD